MLRFSWPTKLVLGLLSGLVLAALYGPMLVTILESFNRAPTSTWPVQEWSSHWWNAAWHSRGMREALGHSLVVAAASTVISLVLGTLAAIALERFRFFGKQSINLMFLLPLAMPAVVSGVALQNFFSTTLAPHGIHLGVFALIAAHSTFCVVVVFNNVRARLAVTDTRLEEASMDLGAGLLTTFRRVTLPGIANAVLAGALLSFSASFEDVIITIFTAPPGYNTLPLWMFNNIARPNQTSLINVAATIVVVLSVLPVWISQRLIRPTTD